MKRTSMLAMFLVLVLAAWSTSSTALADHNERSTKSKAAVIGGGAAAGAVLGGLLGGKKGALAGAIGGGAGAAIYDKATGDDDGHERSSRDKAILIGGSAAAGAAAGGLSKGKKGALIGAAIGAAGGYVLHKKTNGSYRGLF